MRPGEPVKKKNKNMQGNKSRQLYISRPRGGATVFPILTKLGMFVKLADVINSVKYGFDRIRGLRLAEGQISLCYVYEGSRH